MQPTQFISPPQIMFFLSYPCTNLPNSPALHILDVPLPNVTVPLNLIYHKPCLNLFFHAALGKEEKAVPGEQVVWRTWSHHGKL